MPQIIKTKKSLLYAFLFIQLLMTVTLDAAVIRRAKRETAANETTAGTTISSNNDIYSAKVTTEEVLGNFLYVTRYIEDVTTTERTVTDATTLVASEDKKEETTSTGLTIDNNTVSFNSGGQDFHSENEDKNKNEDEHVGSTMNLDESTTITSFSERSSNESTTTPATVGADSPKSFDIKLTTTPFSALKESTSKFDEDESVSTVQYDATKEHEATTESKFDLRPTTLTTNQDMILSTVKMDEITSTESSTEDLSASQASPDDSTTMRDEKDRMKIVKLGAESTFLSIINPDEATEYFEGRKLIDSTEAFKKQLIDSTEVFKEQDLVESTEVSDIGNSTIFPSSEYQEVFTDLNNPIISTTNQSTLKQPLEDKPIPAASTPSFSANKIPILELTGEPLTSTLKSDETTLILTSTEASDEDPIQTTFYSSPISKDLPTVSEIRNSTPASAEKRGKFIDDNYSSYNELRLPNNSDVWALAGLKSTGKVKTSELQNSVETSDEKSVNNSMVTKSLLDWSRVMMTATDDSPESTVKILNHAERTTEVPIVQTTPEASSLHDNELEISTMKATTDAITTEAVNVTDMTDNINTQESKILNENGVDSKTSVNAESTTNLDDKEETSTVERFAIGDSWLSETDDIPLTTKSTNIAVKGRDDTFIEDNQVEDDSIEEKFPTAMATVAPATVTMKSGLTNSPVDGDTTFNAIIGTTTLPSVDFPKSVQFSTSTTISTTITNETTITPTTFDNIDKPLNMASTPTLAQTSPAPATVAEPTTTTTTTTMTTTPAVTVMATTTESEPHMPTIISNEMMTQKSNNYNNYEVLNETATIFADTSSTETAEVSTRVAPNWAVITPETSTAEVEDRLDDLDFDVTTVTNFENNNAYQFATQEPSSTTTVASTLTIAPTFVAPFDTSSSTSTEDLDRIDSIQKISDTAETSIESNVIDRLHVGETSTSTLPPPTTTIPTTTTPMPTTTETSQENIIMQSIGRGGAEISSIPTTTKSHEDSSTTLQSISTKEEDVYSFVPTIDSGFHVPKLVVDDATTTTMPVELAIAGAGGRPMDTPDAQETDVNVIIAISVSAVGIIALILLVAFLYVMRKRQKQMSYGQRCRPVSLDAYSLDNVSVYNSVRRKGAALRASKRSYGNVAFDDPSLRHNVLGTHELAKYVEKKSSIWEEFKDVPQIIARADEVPAGCEDRNRYANVIPLPETRVVLEQLNGDEKSEYINANYVRGPKDTTNYYIACQAPLETTVVDFWRMIWEQNSRVIIMATDLIENGIDKCAEYLPPSVTLDNHTVFGDFQVTLKNREVKEKYAISTLMLKNTVSGESREITHYWYRWPEAGIPTDEAAIIAMLLEARSSLKLYTIEPSDIKIETDITDENKTTVKIEINGNVDKSKTPPKNQGPLTIHCSPGTGRTGTILACDIAMRCLEEPKRCVDIPQIVYSVRRGRASAVQTKEQYEFIYKVAHMYATKISNINNDN